jgi:hypothetical protein
MSWAVPYVNDLAEALAPTKWSLFSILVSAEAADFFDSGPLPRCVQYVRSLKEKRCPQGVDKVGGKFVPMGHSTAANDIVDYFANIADCFANPPPSAEAMVNGMILQAPVLERDQLDWIFDAKGPKDTEAANQAYKWAKEHVRTSRLIPIEMTMPFCGDLHVTTSIGVKLGRMISGEEFFSSYEDDRDEDERGAESMILMALPSDCLLSIFIQNSTSTLLHGLTRANCFGCGSGRAVREVPAALGAFGIPGLVESSKVLHIA